MFKISDGVRAKYLLSGRAQGKFGLWPFIAINKRRYLLFTLYILGGSAYCYFWGPLVIAFFFAGLCMGVLITDFTWLIGRNRGRDFLFETTDWEKVTKLAQVE